MEALCSHLKIPDRLESWLFKRPSIPTLEDVEHLSYGFPEQIERDLQSLSVGVDCSSLDECREVIGEWSSLLREAAGPGESYLVNWQTRSKPREQDYSWTNLLTNDRQEKLERLLKCIRFLRAQLEDRKCPPQATLLMRDALLLYCGESACPSKSDYGLWFLFLERCWDRNSLLPDNGARHLSIQLPIECLHTHLSVLLSVAPGALIEEIDNLFEDIGTWDTDEKWDSPEARERMEQLNVNLRKAMLDLKQFLPRMLLEAFGSMGREAIRFMQLFTFMEFEEVCSLSRIGRELSRAAVSMLAAEKFVHFGRALDEIAEVRREYLSGPHKDFAEGNDIAGADISVGTALDRVEGIVLSTRAALPISPLAVDIASRKECFYFAFLVDHENFFSALYDWIFDKWTALRNHRDDSLEFNMFAYEKLRRPKPDGSDKGRPMYMVKLGAYQEEHRLLMRHVVQQLQYGWETYVGVREFNFCRAYAYWGRHFPHAHDEVYGEFRIKPDRARVAPGKQSQAVDHEIFAQITQIAAAQKKTPFYIIVSGDAGYLEVLDRLNELRGIQYQYWFFENQLVKPQLEHLKGQWVRMEDVLQMDKFDVSKLAAGMNERREREARKSRF